MFKGSDLKISVLSASSWLNYFNQSVSIAPLVVFRVIFGLMMLGSTIRFWYLGWIEDHFLESKFTFKYFGFEWVQLLPGNAMYALHIAMILATIGITLGFLYRFSAFLFFLTFTYIELIDLTYYLNHYYFVSIIAFLLILVPAHRYFSIDTFLNPNLITDQTPRWTILIFQFQLAIVYIYAGLAKINYEWLINALPLKIWLPANDYLPLIGWIFKFKITPYIFSWIGMLYDTTIVFWLMWARSRPIAYLSVIVFHLLTGLLFQIGVFPLIMIGATWIFFSEKFHNRAIDFLRQTGLKIRKLWNKNSTYNTNQVILKPVVLSNNSISKPNRSTFILWTLSVFFIFQLLFPWRYLLYPNNHYWSEEGYRFGWRVMLMEKAGTATFYIKDSQTGNEGIVVNSEFLNPHQEKQMAMQPDMILQFAHFLANHYKSLGVNDPYVRAEVYVTLNGRPSELLIDSQLDLTTIKDSWKPKTWILPYEK